MKHGGDLMEARARYGEGPPAWLDLSTGINPRPWPVPDALRRIGWESLPGQAELRGLLAAARIAYDTPPGAEIVAAPGAQALIQWLPRLAPSGAVAILGPTYGEHAAAWRAAGREVREVKAVEDQADARHLVVVDPNNPDGRSLAPAALAEAARLCSARGGWLVVDESFADVRRGPGSVPLAADGPVVVLRSFGKFYGLAGLRLGFAVTQAGIAASLAGSLGPWAVSGPAITVGTAALADRAWAEASRDRLARDAAGLDEVLTRAGLAVLGGTSLFRLARHPAALDIHHGLAAVHVWVRRFDWAPDLLRFGLPPDETALACLAEALARAVPPFQVQGTRTG